jgi:hypothetical protein
MGTNRQARRWTAWIACLAILLASLAPSISYAVSAARLVNSPFQSEICSVIKLKEVQADGSLQAGYAEERDSNAVTSDGDSQHSSHHPVSDIHFEHCPFCFTHAGSFALPASETLAALAAAPCVARMPLRFYECASPIFVWKAAQPRAPPFFS